MVEGFEIKAQVSRAVNADELWFTQSIFWEDTTPPAEFLREVHVQFTTSLATPVEVTFDDGSTFVPINNGSSVNGLVAFTMFVKSDTLLNFRSTNAITVDVTVTGD